MKSYIAISRARLLSLKLSSIVHESIVDDIRERVLAMWPEGLLFQTYRDDLNEFDVRFYGSPWSASGQLGVMAMKMILELFAVLGRQVCGLFICFKVMFLIFSLKGYMCTSAIDTGRLVRVSTSVHENNLSDSVTCQATSPKLVFTVGLTHTVCSQ